MHRPYSILKLFVVLYVVQHLMASEENIFLGMGLGNYQPSNEHAEFVVLCSHEMKPRAPQK